MTDTTLTTFLNSELTNGKELRWLGTYENPFFIAKDIAEFLEYTNTKKAIIDHVDEDDKISFKQLKQNRGNETLPLNIQDQTILINESGLYSLILRSKLEKAKEFKKWVTSLVLPSIRKNGQYKLESIQKELETTKNNYQTLLLKHNSSLKKHNYVKFKESGPCFYIVDPGIKCECIFNTHRKKFGIAGISTKNEQIDTIDKRLKSHRTTWPLLKVEFILFTKQAIIIEKNFKIIYEKEINPNGHEIIEGISTEVMIKKVKQLLDFLIIKDFYIISGEKLLEYNNYVDTTVKTSNLEDVDIEEQENDEEDIDVENIKVEEQENVKIEENTDIENIKVEEQENVIEENVEDIEKYKKILENIESYKYEKLAEILRSVNLSPSGLKEKRRERLKIFLLDKLSIKKNTRICETCNIDKELVETNFVVVKSYLFDKKYSTICIVCEIEQCKAPKRSLEKTEIIEGMETLLCFKCKETKSVVDFFKDKSRVGRGYEYYCKNCELFSKHGTYDVRKKVVKQKPENIPSDKKWCIYCEKILELINFCPDKQKGYASCCRPCYNKRRVNKRHLQKIIKSQPTNGEN